MNRYNLERAVRFKPFKNKNVFERKLKKKQKSLHLTIWHPSSPTTSSSNSRMFNLNPIQTKSPNYSQLVFYESVPAQMFCNPHPELHIFGTKGRICNSTKSDHSSNHCRQLCCGRGFLTNYFYTTESCQCKFVWCCKVQCKKCLVLKKIETCI